MPCDRPPLLLREHGVDSVVVTGYACEFCVDTTTRRAAGLGFARPIAALASAEIRFAV